MNDTSERVLKRRAASTAWRAAHGEEDRARVRALFAARLAAGVCLDCRAALPRAYEHVRCYPCRARRASDMAETRRAASITNGDNVARCDMSQ